MWLAAAIKWAHKQGLDIINLSLGARTSLGPLVARAIDEAYKSVAIIAAVGNAGPSVDTVCYPAKYWNVIGVGAVHRNYEIADFSSRGPKNPSAYVEENVELVAPGVDILSNKLGAGDQDLMPLSGTSMACPIVTGICALLKQKVKSLCGTLPFRYRLRRTIKDLGIGGPDNFYGIGLAYFSKKS